MMSSLSGCGLTYLEEVAADELAKLPENRVPERSDWEKNLLELDQAY